ncbi:MAG TPA: hypothetical protein VNK44_08905 [Candidatus Nitrosotenuis sp.]|nr:hypothetical protein [Candidatus Nitrosotenuis sp.]
MKIVPEWVFAQLSLIGIGGASISQIIITIFGQTIPQAVTGFFKEIGGVLMLVLVFVFAFTWFLRARPHNKPKNYSVITFDVFGNQISIDGLRTEFKNHDVAWSFMKQYKKDYPLYNFAMVSDSPKSDKKTIFRYI